LLVSHAREGGSVWPGVLFCNQVPAVVLYEGRGIQSRHPPVLRQARLRRWRRRAWRRKEPSGALHSDGCDGKVGLWHRLSKKEATSWSGLCRRYDGPLPGWEMPNRLSIPLTSVICPKNRVASTRPDRPGRARLSVSIGSSLQQQGRGRLRPSSSSTPGGTAAPWVPRDKPVKACPGPNY
jgi:hypothetical protein